MSSARGAVQSISSRPPGRQMLTRGVQRGELILSSEQVLERGQTKEDEIERSLEFQAAHVGAHHSHSGLLHPPLPHCQHRIGGIDRSHLAAASGEGNGQTSASRSEFQHPLCGRRQFEQQVHVVGQVSKIEVVPGRDRAERALLIVRRPVERIVHAASARPRHLRASVSA